jgi:hypothetical protein
VVVHHRGARVAKECLSDFADGRCGQTGEQHDRGARILGHTASYRQSFHLC